MLLARQHLPRRRHAIAGASVPFTTHSHPTLHTPIHTPIVTPISHPSTPNFTPYPHPIHTRSTRARGSATPASPSPRPSSCKRPIHTDMHLYRQTLFTHHLHLFTLLAHPMLTPTPISTHHSRLFTPTHPLAGAATSRARARAPTPRPRPRPCSNPIHTYIHTLFHSRSLWKDLEANNTRHTSIHTSVHTQSTHPEFRPQFHTRSNSHSHPVPSGTSSRQTTRFTPPSTPMLTPLSTTPCTPYSPSVHTLFPAGRARGNYALRTRMHTSVHNPSPHSHSRLHSHPVSSVKSSRRTTRFTPPSTRMFTPLSTPSFTPCSPLVHTLFSAGRARGELRAPRRRVRGESQGAPRRLFFMPLPLCVGGDR